MPLTDTAVPQTVTIANTGTTSSELYLGGTAVLGIELPATITGTALAIHGCSTRAGTYGALRDSAGSANAFTVTGNGRYYVDPIMTAGWPFIKIVMTAQSQDTTVTLLTRPV